MHFWDNAGMAPQPEDGVLLPRELVDNLRADIAEYLEANPVSDEEWESMSEALERIRVKLREISERAAPA